MGWLLDTLKEIPLSAVLKEKVTAIEDKYAASETQVKLLEGDLRKAEARIRQLTQENEWLKQQVEDLSHSADIDDVEIGILKKMADIGFDHFTVRLVGHQFDMSPSRLDYHLRRLNDAGYASSPFGDDAGWHWAPTQKGLELLVKKDLI